MENKIQIWADLLGAGVGAGVLLMLGFGANVLTPGIGAKVV